MFNSNPLLNHLRSKPQRTKTAIAVIAALIPTLAVSYAQFYMRAHDFGKPAVAQEAGSSGNEVSIFAAVGKIFDEGKKTIASSVDSLKNIDTSVLESAIISASSTGSSTKADKLDLGAVPGAEWSNVTVTKSNEN